eukprot:scaffold7800_cov363-Pinguiococcus_pyrenoidosus.AAC.1
MVHLLDAAPLLQDAADAADDGGVDGHAEKEALIEHGELVPDGGEKRRHANAGDGVKVRRLEHMRQPDPRGGNGDAQARSGVLQQHRQGRGVPGLPDMAHQRRSLRPGLGEALHGLVQHDAIHRE